MFDNYRHKDYVESYRDLYIHDPFWSLKYHCNESIISGIINEPACEAWIDLCCGQGQYFNLAKNIKHIQCIGIDISSEQIMLANSSHGETAKATFLIADILDEALPDLTGPADLVTIMWGAYCYLKGNEEILSMLRNVSQLLRPGGSFYIEVIEPTTLSSFNTTSFSKSSGAHVKDVNADADGNTYWLYEDTGGTHQLYSPTLEWMLAAINDLGLSAKHLSTVQTLHQVIARRES